MIWDYKHATFKDMCSRTKLSKKQTQRLLKESGWLLDSELTNKVAAYGETVYQNSDGKVLVNMGLDGGNVFKTKADCIKYLEDLEKAIQREKAASSLSHRIPQGKNFVNEVPRLIDNLALTLKISRAELDNSESSISKVERALKRIGRYKCLEPEIFAPLVAYVGEVIRQATGGRWLLRFSNDEQAWEPWIVDSKGDVHPPFIILLKELLDASPYSISGATSWEIYAYRNGMDQGWIHGREQGWENNNV